MNTTLPHHERPSSRRDFLARAGGGLGLVALAALAEDTHAAAPPATPAGPLAARRPHFEPAATACVLAVPRSMPRSPLEYIELPRRLLPVESPVIAIPALPLKAMTLPGVVRVLHATPWG